MADSAPYATVDHSYIKGTGSYTMGIIQSGARANATGYKLLPIKIGVSISYIFK